MIAQRAQTTRRAAADGISGSMWRIGRRPALDGLRGIAVLLVFGFHVGVPHMDGGGAAGVTVFFTLSGFLITALLLEEYERAGRISLRAFYERRVRRLTPALLAVTFAVVAFTPVSGTSWFDLHALPSVLLFYGNWLQVTTQGTGLGAMGVTWSLAVEEQFYVIWPVLLIAALWRGRRERVLALALAGAAISLMVRVHMIAAGATQEEVYFPTSTNAFPLLLGCALAAWLGGWAAPIPRWRVSALGVMVLLLPVVWLGKPAHELGPPLVSLASVLVLMGVAGSAPHPILSSAVLRWVGERSYGIYLIHGPITVLLRNLWRWPTLSIFAVALPLTLLLADASYRWVEMPFRRRPALASRQATDVIADAMAHEPS